MKRTRVAKVDNVKLARRGQEVGGTVHLTPHHLIFVHQPPTPAAPAGSTQQPAKPNLREIWITYPIIQHCTLKISPPASPHPSTIRLRCRDFNFYCFYIQDENEARATFESIRSWTCRLGKIDKLCAFSYQPQQPEKDLDSWSIYDARREYRRMGIGGEKAADSGWRISNLNADYSFSPTYPKVLVVPSSISDNTLKFAIKFRSKGRLPVLTYLHSVNNCTITRCSQPMVGLRQSRSIQDEKLLLAIYSATNARASDEGAATAKGPSADTSEEKTAAPEKDSLASNISSKSSRDDIAQTNQSDTTVNVLDQREAPELSHSGTDTPVKNDGAGEDDTIKLDMSVIDIEAAEDQMIALGGVSENGKPLVYGAQRHNLIVDARPIVNAVFMTAAGMGSEIMDNYPFAEKVYLGIDNIHVMRNSLETVIEALKDSDITSLEPNRHLLAKSDWTKHIANMLDGVGIIVRQVGIQSSSVVIHCSDGWDRTSQLSALSELCLDPYYRTLEGFMILVEKDWLSFGHMFAKRSGYLSSEKWFHVEKERSFDSHKNPRANRPAGAIEDAFLKAKGFFRQEQTRSRESLVDSDSEDSSPENTQGTASPVSASDRHQTKVKEVAPMFHQFLDATYQLLYQNPNRFEFNERFLRRLLYHLYSCQYGTFLFDSERERNEYDLKSRTRSVWDYFLSRKQQFINPNYDPEINDMERGKERLMLPRPPETRWWSEVFGREDHEMNGPPASLSTANSSVGELNLGSSDSSNNSASGHPLSMAGVENAERSIAAVPVASNQSGTSTPTKKMPAARLGSGASPFARFESSSTSRTSPSPAARVSTASAIEPTIDKIEGGISDLHVDTKQSENYSNTSPFASL